MHSNENKTRKLITLGPLKWESINTLFYKTVANVSTTFSLWQGLWKEKYMRPGWIKNRYEICKVIHVKWQQQKELLFNYFSYTSKTEAQSRSLLLWIYYVLLTWAYSKQKDSSRLHDESECSRFSFLPVGFLLSHYYYILAHSNTFIGGLIAVGGVRGPVWCLSTAL